MVEYGCGHGYGTGYGHGEGYGCGHGDGTGTGDGGGDGTGHGYGYGTGDDFGCGCGHTPLYTVSHETPIIAYHYVRDDMRLRHPHDGERVRIDVGTVLEIDGEPETCKRGLHASLTVEDARQYAGVSGVLTRVACSGRVIYGFDKLVCTRREVLEVIDD